MTKYYTGTAGWTIPSKCAALFSSSGSHLERYGKVLNSVEINSSFYRDHSKDTYARWAASVPDDFRFAVKLSRKITHDSGLNVDLNTLNGIVSPILKLDTKLGVILIQLPPKFEFDAALTSAFFRNMRSLYRGAIAVEPRNRTWSGRHCIELFHSFRLARVIADPNPLPDLSLETFAKLSNLTYFRLHGSPEIYKSNYAVTRLKHFRAMAEKSTGKANDVVWYIFDNTTFGHATQNALTMHKLVDQTTTRRSRRKSMR